MLPRRAIEQGLERHGRIYNINQSAQQNAQNLEMLDNPPIRLDCCNNCLGNCLRTPMMFGSYVVTHLVSYTMTMGAMSPSSTSPELSVALNAGALCCNYIGYGLMDDYYKESNPDQEWKERAKSSYCLRSHFCLTGLYQSCINGVGIDTVIRTGASRNIALAGHIPALIVGLSCCAFGLCRVQDWPQKCCHSKDEQVDAESAQPPITTQPTSSVSAIPGTSSAITTQPVSGSGHALPC